MHIVTTTLWLPKKGNTTEEYEDAAFPEEAFETSTDHFKCAVADGATETSFSGLWARLLVEGFVSGTDRQELKKRWADSIADRALAWYAEQKAESGAYAALVGLTLNENHGGDGGTWEAEAIGDSCLVLVREGKFVQTFPLKESEQFNSSPVLISSNLDASAQAEEEFTFERGTWSKGDTFYLLSDAIARWTFKRQEDYGDAAHWLKSMNSQEDIINFSDVQRDLTDADTRPMMRNDDVTMMRIVID